MDIHETLVSLFNTYTNENEKDMKKIIKTIAKSSVIPKKVLNKDDNEFN